MVEVELELKISVEALSELHSLFERAPRSFTLKEQKSLFTLRRKKIHPVQPNQDPDLLPQTKLLRYLSGFRPV
jgi:hypothetical protein